VAGFGAFRWQRGYGAFTLDPSRLSGILRYVAQQIAHLGAGTTWPRYERTS
jgi:hypothetical protein